jgi:hypothetical protein
MGAIVYDRRSRRFKEVMLFCALVPLVRYISDNFFQSAMLILISRDRRDERQQFLLHAMTVLSDVLVLISLL